MSVNLIIPSIFRNRAPELTMEDDSGLFPLLVSAEEARGEARLPVETSRSLADISSPAPRITPGLLQALVPPP